MTANLLERDRELATLDTLLGEIKAGQGRIAVVSGEAGIGKTALVERFIAHTPDGVRSLWGACEALFTPRPLGPLYDIAQRMRPAVRELLGSDAKRAPLFAAILDDLTSIPTILVIEDIHWADEATLDFIKYLARRIAQTSTLLVLTYRDDELSRDHPLRLVLGDLPSREVIRLRLLPLSEDAVTALALKATRPAKEVYRATQGNPFFVTETLASDELDLPTSISDAVLARVSRRSPEAQRLLDVVAVSPGRTERWAIAALAPGEEALDECLAAGMLHVERNMLAFRHELARQAVEGALSLTRRQTLNAQLLHALLQSEVEPVALARLAHHAAEAEDSRLVLRFAPEAARQASAHGAHREAATHYKTALHYAKGLDTEHRAELLDGLAYEYYLTGRIEDAIEPCAAALTIWQALDMREKVGHDLRQLSRLYWFLGRAAEAERYAAEAIGILETLPQSRELAMAYGNMSQLRMLVSDNAQTLIWGKRAIELAERLHDAEIVSYALNTMGASEYCGGDVVDGLAMLERSLKLALEHGFEEHVARAYVNLADNDVKHREYAQARHYFQEGMAYCAEHDLDTWNLALQGIRAQARLDQGDWAGADEDVTAILDVSWSPAANRIPALIVLGSVRARRGDPGAQQVFDEARDLAVVTGEMQTISPVAAARAEWRWLQGNREQCAAEAAVGFQAALHTGRPWYLGEVAIWLWRGGGLSDLSDPLEEIAAPFSCQMAGDWCAAARAWEQIGCPYEQALALIDGDEAAQRTALAIFERLGAAPAAELTRKRLRQTGARGLPRGPRPTTRANPHGLTNRQLEILVLMAEGLRNLEIAERLSTTPKTIEHHVSAVLSKLGARSRIEAVNMAYQLGLIPQTSQLSPLSPAT
jgi:DNA-binding CsgD family transcriptional regulator/tetratricopeptide (TPR) repeat protein